MVIYGALKKTENASENTVGNLMGRILVGSYVLHELALTFRNLASCI